MASFKPNYRNLILAATNQRPTRMPLYEHIISEKLMEVVLDREFSDLQNGNPKQKREYMDCYIRFFLKMGYDTVSFERCIGSAMPGEGALGGSQKAGIIQTREDFELYPWAEIKDRFFDAFGEDFEILGEMMPPGMKAVGGPGNGVFELAQDLVGYTRLCYMRKDDPELYRSLFAKIGEIMFDIWREFLDRYGHNYAVCRFGDDLGFKTSTLLSPEEIRELIIPEYHRIIALIHNHNHPFLLHSCGNIFAVMDDLIRVAGIDAKHSNEDLIAPFSEWIERYGDEIGIFGGIDTDILCRKSEEEIRKAVRATVHTAGEKGFALGSGNSIPDYVPLQGYYAMIEEGHRLRSEVNGQ